MANGRNERISPNGLIRFGSFWCKFKGDKMNIIYIVFEQIHIDIEYHRFGSALAKLRELNHHIDTEIPFEFIRQTDLVAVCIWSVRRYPGAYAQQYVSEHVILLCRKCFLAFTTRTTTQNNASTLSQGRYQMFVVPHISIKKSTIDISIQTHTHTQT